MRAPSFAVIALTISAATGAEIMLDDFERTETEMQPSVPQGALVSLVPAPDRDGHTALRIGWPTSHGAFVQCAFIRVRPAGEIKEGRPAAALVDVWVDAPTAAREIGVRFSDRDEEVFQWVVSIPDTGRPGWRTLRIPLETGTINSHWGDRSNGTLDFPLSLSGFAVALATGDEGAVLLDDVRVEPAP